MKYALSNALTAILTYLLTYSSQSITPTQIVSLNEDSCVIDTFVKSKYYIDFKQDTVITKVINQMNIDTTFKSSITPIKRKVDAFNVNDTVTYISEWYPFGYKKYNYKSINYTNEELDLLTDILCRESRSSSCQADEIDQYFVVLVAIREFQRMNYGSIRNLIYNGHQFSKPEPKHRHEKCWSVNRKIVKNVLDCTIPDYVPFIPESTISYWNVGIGTNVKQRRHLEKNYVMVASSIKGHTYFCFLQSMHKDIPVIPVKYAAGMDSIARAQIRSQIVAIAKKHLGTRYVYAGKKPGGFDCSGFTAYVMNVFGIVVSPSSRHQALQGKAKPLAQAEVGDLVFFSRYGKGGRISHVALVVNNTPDGVEVIHATSRGIVIDNINQSKYWRPKILFAKDVISM